MATPRIYVDTSVFGGVFESEFKWASEELFQQIRDGSFQLVTSAVVQDEIEPAPLQVRELFETMLPYAELIIPNPDAVTLQQAYIQSNIVTRKYAGDALHVALATVSGCALIVSWNFKHLVHYDKVALYNAVNLIHGYPQISIISPWEVIRYE